MSGIATAIVGGSIVSGYMGGKATESAANTAAGSQDRASQLSVEEQRRQFDAMRELMQPYVDAGSPALQQMAEYTQVGPDALRQMQDLNGMNGFGAQQAAINTMEQSPLFQAQIAQGEDAMLQNASATGGLRGGNIQGALSQYRPQMLSQMIEQRYNQLGGMQQIGQANTNNLASIGQSSAAGVGNSGMGMAANIGNLNMQAGDARAQAALASGQANANMWGNIGNSVSSLGTMGMLGYGPLAK